MLQPRPAYAAIATHTLVMDGAKFVRAVPTELLSLYVTEFQRGDEWIYPIWTARGERNLRLTFAGTGAGAAAAPVKIIDLYGREKNGATPATAVQASTSVQYLVTKNRLQKVEIGSYSFADEPPPVKFTLLDQMDDAGHLKLVTLKHHDWDSGLFRTKGTQFQLRDVNDPERGPCVELELTAEGMTDFYTHEYATINFTRPLAVAEGRNCGVWVKGNGGWGEVKFSINTPKGGFQAQNVVYNK